MSYNYNSYNPYYTQAPSSSNQSVPVPIFYGTPRQNYTYSTLQGYSPSPGGYSSPTSSSVQIQSIDPQPLYQSNPTQQNAFYHTPESEGEDGEALIYAIPTCPSTTTGSEFPSAADLESHMRTIHKPAEARKDEKYYPCLIKDCPSAAKGYKFTRAADLERHMKVIHFPIYTDCPHKWCGRIGSNGFSRKDHLAEHIRQMHTENIPKCSRGKGAR